MSMTGPDAFEYLLRLADDRLILGHRLSEWCGHAPILEEDIALANISLDLIGEANLLLQLAGESEGKGRDPDALAYFREAIEFHIEGLRENGQPVPPPSSTCEIVDVKAA